MLMTIKETLSTPNEGLTRKTRGNNTNKPSLGPIHLIFRHQLSKRWHICTHHYKYKWLRLLRVVWQVRRRAAVRTPERPAAQVVRATSATSTSTSRCAVHPAGPDGTYPTGVSGPSPRTTRCNTRWWWRVWAGRARICATCVRRMWRWVLK